MARPHPLACGRHAIGIGHLPQVQADGRHGRHHAPGKPVPHRRHENREVEQREEHVRVARRLTHPRAEHQQLDPHDGRTQPVRLHVPRRRPQHHRLQAQEQQGDGVETPARQLARLDRKGQGDTHERHAEHGRHHVEVGHLDVLQSPRPLLGIGHNGLPQPAHTTHRPTVSHAPYPAMRNATATPKYATAPTITATSRPQSVPASSQVRRRRAPNARHSSAIES